MKKRVLAMVMALCITAAHTAGAYAAPVDETPPQIAAEESVEVGGEAEASYEIEIGQKEIKESDAAAKEESEAIYEESFVEGASSEPDEIQVPEDSSDMSDEISDGISDMGDVGPTDEEAAHDNESEDIPDFGNKAIDDIVEEISEEESNAALEMNADSDSDTEQEITEIIENTDTLGVAKSALSQLIESPAGSYAQNPSKAALSAKTDENMNKLINYISKYGTADSDGFKTIKGTTRALTNEFSCYPEIKLNSAKGFVKFALNGSIKSSIQDTSIFVDFDYYINDKEFGHQIGCMCVFTDTLFYVASANINEAAYLMEQVLSFKIDATLGFKNDIEYVNNSSNTLKDIALLSLDLMLQDKNQMSLCSIGFSRFLDFSKVEYRMPSTSYAYTGKEILPAVKVSYLGFPLTKGVQYKLSGRNNINVGKETATVKVSAIGGLSGSEEFIFTILPGASKKVTIYNVAQGIKVTWLKVESATKYYVYRDGKLIKTTSVLEITDGDVKYRSGQKFTYKVVATTKGVGDSTAARTGTYYRLMPVGIKSITNSGAGKMTVTYDKSSGSSGYVVRYGLNSDMSDAKVITVQGENTLSRTFNNLTKGKTYYVQVRTYKIDNGVRYYSGYCTTKTVKIVK